MGRKESDMHETESESQVAQSCMTLCDSMDCSPPASSVLGILQARIRELVAISCSGGPVGCGGMEMDFRRSGGQITTIPVYKVHPQLTLPGQGLGGG